MSCPNLTENVNLIHFATNKVRKRLAASGFTIDYDDVFQETALVWLECEKGFKPELELRFSTYFLQAVHFTVFKRFTKNNERLNAAAFSLNEEIDDELVWEPADPADGIVETMLGDEQINEIERNLSPMAARVFRLLINPPKMILDSIDAMKAKADFAETLGLSGRSPQELTMSSLFRILRLETGQRAKIRSEIRRIMNDHRYQFE